MLRFIVRARRAGGCLKGARIVGIEKKARIALVRYKAIFIAKRSVADWIDGSAQKLAVVVERSGGGV